MFSSPRGRTVSDPVVMTETHVERLFSLFSGLAQRSDFRRAYPEARRMIERASAARRQEHGDAFEEALVAAYCRMHAADAVYGRKDAARLKAMQGYGCYAGGLEPVFAAGDYLSPESRFADYGAGNGLQGLLVQWLFPHRETLQVEFNRDMIRRGQALQRMMEIDEERIRWIASDMREVSPEGVDVVYLYRPFRPEGAGAEFYRDFAVRLAHLAHPVTVLSVADCLEPLLDRKNFRKLRDTGHLRIFSNR